MIDCSVHILNTSMVVSMGHTSFHINEVIDHVLLLTSINLNNMPEAISKSQQPLSQNFKTKFTQQPCSNKLCKEKLIILYLELWEAFCLFWWKRLTYVLIEANLTQTTEEFWKDSFQITKIPSDMEVALCYKLFTMLAGGIYAYIYKYIYCCVVRALLW